MFRHDKKYAASWKTGLHGILRINWEAFRKVLVASKLFIVWDYAYKNTLLDHQYHILRLHVEIVAVGAKSYEICFQD